MSTARGQVSVWGNGLAIRLTKPVAQAAGLAEGMAVKLVAKAGRVVIEVEAKPSLEQMLARFDPVKHGGEAMADHPIGVEFGGE